MILEIQDIVAGFFLMINTIMDIKTKKVSMIVILVGMIVGIGIKLKLEMFFQWESLWAIIPGVVVLGFSFITRQQIGYGDGMTIIMLGLFVTSIQIISICMLAVWFAGIVSIVLLLILHKNKKYEIPFIPFLFVSYVLVRCIT